MAISTEEVNRIGTLARLSFDDSEKQKLQHELSDILAYVDQLKQLESKIPTEVIDPDAENLMRNDVVEVTSDPEEFLKQAPDRQGNFIKVKSILD